MNPALLILDPQNDFFENDNPNLAEFQRVVPNINAAIAVFRERNLPIIFIQHTSQTKAEGMHAWAIHEEFDCRSEDIRLCKTYSNAFWQSELDSLLKSLQVDHVFVTGFISEHCVLSTFRGALERGYQGAILTDAIASLNNQHTKFVLAISKHIPLDELTETNHKHLMESLENIEKRENLIVITPEEWDEKYSN